MHPVKAKVPSLYSLTETAWARALVAEVAAHKYSTEIVVNLVIATEIVHSTVMPRSIRAGLMRAVLELYRKMEYRYCGEYFVRKVDPHRPELVLENKFREIWGLPESNEICFCCGRPTYEFSLEHQGLSMPTRWESKILSVFDT